MINVPTHRYSKAYMRAWGRIKREEEKELEKVGSDMLKRILNLPLSTPYTGILMETGIWPVMARINYATVMLFYSVINSNDRLATDSKKRATYLTHIIKGSRR